MFYPGEPNPQPFLPPRSTGSRCDQKEWVDRSAGGKRRPIHICLATTAVVNRLFIKRTRLPTAARWFHKILRHDRLGRPQNGVFATHLLHLAWRHRATTPTARPWVFLIPIASMPTPFPSRTPFIFRSGDFRLPTLIRPYADGLAVSAAASRLYPLATPPVPPHGRRTGCPTATRLFPLWRPDHLLSKDLMYERI